MLGRKREEEVTEVGAEDAAKPAKVVNLMDALRKSLASATREPRASAAKRSAPSVRRTKVLKHPAAKARRRAS
jgi:non-homologous end joining protein Ku